MRMDAGRQHLSKRPEMIARLAWALLGVSGALLAGAIRLQMTGPEGFTEVLVLAPTALAFGAVGSVLAAKIPRNPIGWLFLVFALLNSWSVLGEAWATHIADGTDSPTAIWLSFWLTETVPPALLAFALLVFPTGRLGSRAARLAAWTMSFATAVAGLGAAVEPGRMGTLGPLPEIALTLLVVGGIGGSAAAVLWRMRRARGERRQQVKWFAYSAALLAVDLVLAGASATLLGDPGPEIETISFFVFVVVLSTVPVAMGIAVMRYRLYDIDRVINKTIVYALMTGAEVLVYSATVFVAGTVAAGSGGQLAVAIATLAAAAAFRPLLKRVQGFVDRRFYRRKYDTQKTVDAFGSRLREEIDLDDLTDDLLGVVRSTMQPAHATVWLRREQAEG